MGFDQDGKIEQATTGSPRERPDNSFKKPPNPSSSLHDEEQQQCGLRTSGLQLPLVSQIISNLANCVILADGGGGSLKSPSIQVPPRVLVQAATPLADSPSEEREDALFCSFDDSPLSQVLPISPL